MQAVFDGHNDALTRADHASFAGGRDGGHLDLPRMRAGGMRGGIFAIFSPSPQLAPPPPDDADEFPPPLAHGAAAAHATAAAGRLLALEHAGEMRVARTIADVDAALEDGAPPVAVLHLEGVEALDEGLEALDLWHAAGLRSLGPVWSRSNAFAHGVPFVSPSSPDIGPGLTQAGRALVRRCGELGVLVDVSHLNEAGFWDVARLETGPVVASHSGAHALCATSRNLTDAQLDEIGATGGLVGIVFACAFLRADFVEDPETTSPQLIVDHARHVADRIGVEHVALGSDFDGATLPAGLDAAALPALLDGFAAAGFTSAEVEAIAWGNWRRVLDAWWSR